MKWLLILVLLAALVSCAAPPFINQVKTVPSGDNLVICWTTLRPARCQVFMCQGELCIWSAPEAEFSTLHQYSMPAAYTDSVAIECIERSGRKSTYSIVNELKNRL